MTEATAGLVTLHEAAERLGVHYMTAYRRVRMGMLPAGRSAGRGGSTRPISTAGRGGRDGRGSAQYRSTR